MEAIFYNIWAHYSDLDYAFLGGKLTDLIGEWLKEERLNAPKAMPSSTPLGPPTRIAIEIETILIEATEQQLTVKVDKETATPNLPIDFKDPTSELSSRVLAIQSLINLEEEPVATDVEEEPKAAVDLTVV